MNSLVATQRRRLPSSLVARAAERGPATRAAAVCAAALAPCALFFFLIYFFGCDLWRILGCKCGLLLAWVIDCHWPTAMAGKWPSCFSLRVKTETTGVVDTFTFFLPKCLHGHTSSAVNVCIFIPWFAAIIKFLTVTQFSQTIVSCGPSSTLCHQDRPYVSFLLSW
jgi:hypothetical protein